MGTDQGVDYFRRKVTKLTENVDMIGQVRHAPHGVGPLCAPLYVPSA
jgi:hypothetical protein